MSGNLRHFPYLLVLAAIGAGIEVDLSLPSFPDIAKYFGVSEDQVAGTISLNFLGFCLAALVYGPLADLFGRRPIMLAGSTLFVAGSLGCAFAQSMDVLLACRLLQGLGAAASFVIVFIMISDVYSGDEATGWVGFLNATLTGAMAGAPIVGGFLNAYFGWRAPYTFVATWASAVFVLLAIWLPETRKGRSISLYRVGKDYLTLLSSGRFVQASLIPTLLAGAYLSFISVIPFLYRDEMGMSLFDYSLHQACIISAFSIMSYYAHRIAQAVGARRAATTGLIITAVSTCSLLGLSIATPVPAAWKVTPLMVTFAATCAVAFAVVFAASLAVFPEKNGPAASLLMSMRTLVCAATIQLGGSFYNGTFLPPATLVAICCLLSLGLALRFYATQNAKTASPALG